MIRKFLTRSLGAMMRWLEPFWPASAARWAPFDSPGIFTLDQYAAARAMPRGPGD
jgi:hypothetical protein